MYHIYEKKKLNDEIKELIAQNAAAAAPERNAK